ncbi:MAG TPA: hypothetical protein DCZ95_17445 [Verrucomicrobia bacterium]|nr:MAG: hypothetical protein A2X46_17515 [Lentisphaerae bacterium GWF2_57_35]HBA85871.1 hypothetical protein [Verrucomicrobiota bacterium]
MKRWLQCIEAVVYRVGKAELISVGAAILAALSLGAVLLFPQVGAGEGSRSSFASVADFKSYAMEERSLDSSTLSFRPKTAAAAPVTPTAPDEEALDLAEENRALQTRLNDLCKWILTNFKGKYPLSEKFMTHLRMAPITDDYMLSSEVAEFLKVTPSEVTRINDAFLSAADTLHQIEAATITVKNPRPDKVILSIPAFEEAGLVMKEDLYAALEVTLGGARFDRFLEVSEKDLAGNFYQFGAASRTMIFELAYTSETEMPQLVIRDAWIMPGEHNTRTIEAVESTVTNLPARYQSYQAWLPDYVSAYAATP